MRVGSQAPEAPEMLKNDLPEDLGNSSMIRRESKKSKLPRPLMRIHCRENEKEMVPKLMSMRARPKDMFDSFFFMTKWADWRGQNKSKTITNMQFSMQNFPSH